jgi:predicted TIM-barrel fold metal-dependent hydrolase
VVFSSHPDKFGCPHVTDKHWDPLWALAQDLQMPINFHIGSGGIGDFGYEGDDGSIRYVIDGSLVFLTNANPIVHTIIGGVCERFPKLNFVSVESGVGWIPFLLETMDWQWANVGFAKNRPAAPIPSEIFRRQWYSCFWFERGTVGPAIEAMGVDHVLYETDFPHSNSQAPGPASPGVAAREYIADVFSDFSEETRRKVLHDNAATLYNWS